MAISLGASFAGELITPVVIKLVLMLIGTLRSGYMYGQSSPTPSFLLIILLEVHLNLCCF